MNKAFENNFEIEKIKVTSAEIVVHGTSEKPYYEIRYYDISDGKYHIGYSSYDLSIVFGWLKDCFEIVKEVAGECKDGWIPIDEKLPPDDSYILLSFSNFSVPIVGRYEETEDGGGNFFAGDEDEPLISQDMYVNAWMPLPKPYEEV